MRKIKNPLYIGTEGITQLPQAKEIKHGATITTYKLPKELKNLTKETPVTYLALNFKTDPTGEVMLLGYCNEIIGRTTKKGYSYLYKKEHGLEKIIEMLITLSNYCIDKNKQFCYWEEAHAISILNLLLEYKGIEGKEKAPYFERFNGGTKGSYHKELGWVEQPVIEVEVNGKKFGIMQNINGRLNLFFQTKSMSVPKTVFALDSSVFFENDLETEAQENLNWDYQHNKELDLINWFKFEEEYKTTNADIPNADEQTNYPREVLESNKNDCYATLDLMHFAQTLFIETFNCNPRLMFSAGNLARVALAKHFEHNHEELESVNWNKQMEDFLNNENSKENVTSLYNIAIDSYNAGLTDLLQIGYTPQGAQADINSSYPSIMANGLLDLRGAKIVTGGACKFSEVPKPNGTNYVFLTPIIEGVDTSDIHTITLKAQATEEENNKSLLYNLEKLKENKNSFDRNLRASGDFIASCLYEEVDFLKRQMEEKGTYNDFEVVEWVEIQTKGKLTPLKSFIETYFELRKELKAKNDKRQFMLKLILNSIYGNFFQCVPNVQEGKETIDFLGWDAGELFNPIYATVICAYARLRLAEAQLEVVKNNGKPILQAIDALHWEGTKDMLPQNFTSILSHYEGLKLNGWRSEKTLCFFEEPKEFTQGFYLKVGVYEYFDTDTGVFNVKAMGFSLEDFTQKDKSYLRQKVKVTRMVKKGTHLPEKLKPKFTTSDYFITLPQKILITPAMALEKDEEGNYTSEFKATGSYIKRETEVKFNDVVPKRRLLRTITFEKMETTLTPTYPIDASSLGGGDQLLINSDGSINWASALGAHFDGRLISFRELVKDKNVFVTVEERQETKKENNKKSSSKYRDKCKDLREQVLNELDVQMVITVFGEKFTKNKKMAEKIGLEKMKKLLLDNGITPSVD